MRSLLARHWFLFALLIGLGATLGLPHLFKPLTDYWEPRKTVAASLLLVAWTMPTRSLMSELREPLASIWAILLSYVLVPLGGVVLGMLSPDADVRIGLILVSCVPCTLSSAVLWTRLAGGNEATALLAVMGTTVLSWLVTTGLLLGLTGTAVSLDMGAMMFDLFMSLIVPTALGQALRRVPPCKAFAERHKITIGAIAQCFVLAIVAKAGVGVGEKLQMGSAVAAPRIFGWSITLAVALHLLAVAGGFISSRWLKLDRGRQIAVAFASSQKTLQISLVLYEQYFKEYAYALMPMLFYHVGQLLLDTLIARRLRASAANQEPDA